MFTKSTVLALGAFSNALNAAVAGDNYWTISNRTDPACLAEPPRIVTITDDPTPYVPPAEAQGGGGDKQILWESVETHSPTSVPTSAPTIADCDTWVKSYSLIDTDADEVVPGYEKLYDGQKLVLKDLLPRNKFTIMANVDDSAISRVKFFARPGGDQEDKRQANGFTINGGTGTSTNLEPWNRLNIAGTYVISAKGYNGSWESGNGDEMCKISITVEYGNDPTLCSGLVESFALFDIEKQEVVPGYEKIMGDQKLVLKEFPKSLGIIANANGYESGQVYFGLDGKHNKEKQTSAPYSFGKKSSGKILPFNELTVSGHKKIFAYGRNAKGDWENYSTDSCVLNLDIDYGNPGVCKGLVEGLALVNVTTGERLPHGRLVDGMTLDLKTLPREVSVEAITNGFDTGVYFKVNNKKNYKKQTTLPYVVQGKTNAGLPIPFDRLQNDGTLTIGAKGRNSKDDWETDSEFCQVTINIIYGNKGRCKGLISQLQIVNAATGVAVEGYERLSANTKINLEHMPPSLAIAAVGTGSQTGVRFGLNSNKKKKTYKHTADVYYYGGISNGQIVPQSFLRTEGSYKIMAKGRQMDEDFEHDSDFCAVELEVDYGDEGICDGLVKGFALYDTVNKRVVPGSESLPLTGTVIDLSEDSQDLTIIALGRGLDTGIEFGVDNKDNVHKAFPGEMYAISDVDGNGDALPFTRFKVAGDYVIKAKGRKANGKDWEKDSEFCKVDVKVINGPTDATCPGVVQGFALVQIEDDGSYTEIPGFDVFGGQPLVLNDFDRPLSLLAKTNGVEKQVQFKKQGSNKSYKIKNMDYIMSGKDNSGNYKPLDFFQAAGTYTLMAKAQMADDDWESDSMYCKFTLAVEYGTQGPCTGLISGFRLVDALDNEYLNSFSPIKEGQTIDLDVITNPLNIVADTVKFAKEVRFDAQWEGRNGWKKNFRKEKSAPFAMAGDVNGDFKALKFLRNVGTHKIRAKAKNMLGDWEDDFCEVSVVVTGAPPPETNPPPPVAPESPPKKILIQATTIDEGTCAPKYIEPIEGDIMFSKTPLEIIKREVNQTITFKTVNFINEREVIDWVTTSFVMPAGPRVCHMTENLGIGQAGPEEYTTKCFDGFAYVDIYARDANFDATLNAADVSDLHAGCKKDSAGGTVKYSFILSCDCDNIPVIPAELWGGPEAKNIPKCVGRKAGSWGDPHLTSWDRKKFNCQGNGEFKLANADIANKPYGLAMQSRFRKFAASKWGSRVSFNDGFVISQDHSVQINRADVVTDKTTYFGDCPINFYVDGVQRNILHGSGIQHKVMVTVGSQMKVDVYFPETGVTVYGKVRPGAPCKFDYDICIPEDNKNIVNVTGLFGNHNGMSTDDFRDPAGNQLNPSSHFDYCTQNWCIRDQAESMFSYDSADFGFGHFMKCDAFTEGGKPDLNAASAIVKKICGCEFEPDLNKNVMESKFCYPDCVLDGLMGEPDHGEEEARLAIAAIREEHQSRISDLFESLECEGACCSFDYKTCFDVDDEEKRLANVDRRSCDDYIKKENRAGVWLSQGEWDEDTDYFECKKFNYNCQAHLDCCPGLGCGDNGKCVEMVVDTGTTGDGTRRLMGAERPDLAIGGKTVLFTSMKA